MRKLVYEEVKKHIEESPESSSVYVGVDSQVIDGHTHFALVVVIHIASSKGSMVFAEKSKDPKYMAISERLMKEVDMAVKCAMEIHPYVGNRKFEVHLDFNPDSKYKSHSYVAAASGYVSAMGFDYKIKPGAFAASYCADHLLH
jgi:predicted RNase H-related nuclease YkuK (DUF458 family)